MEFNCSCAFKLSDVRREIYRKGIAGVFQSRPPHGSSLPAHSPRANIDVDDNITKVQLPHLVLRSHGLLAVCLRVLFEEGAMLCPSQISRCGIGSSVDFGTEQQR